MRESGRQNEYGGQPTYNDLPSQKIKKSKHIDYLAEMREKRELGKDSDNYKRRNFNERSIDQLMRDQTLNEYERLSAVKRKAD